MLKPELSIYPQSSDRIQIVPADFQRQWMNDTPNGFAYRCLPLSIANSSGWQLLNPLEFEAEWDGSDRQDGIKITAPRKRDLIDQTVSSHFGCGILTFHTGYIFRTSPGWATWVRGIPNTHKEGIFALDGVVETDWLPFVFTMNWKFTKPGKVKFEQDEPFCFVTLLPHMEMDSIEPKIKVMDQKLFENYHAWSASRTKFNERQEPGWQKNYTQGQTLSGEKATYHVTKRKLKSFSENI